MTYNVLIKERLNADNLVTIIQITSKGSKHGFIGSCCNQDLGLGIQLSTKFRLI